MRSLLAAVAAVALVAAAGACGSTITVPDQGTIVLGCRTPSFCYLTNCDCLRASTAGPPNLTSPGGKCTVSQICGNGDTPAQTDDPGSCYCPPQTDMGQVQCMEQAQVCTGRGTFCGGEGAFCLAAGGIPAGSTCADVSGDPPQLVLDPTTGTLEPHCQFVDDICCGDTTPPAPDMGVPIEPDDLGGPISD